MKIAPDGQAALFAAISTTTSPGKLQALAFDKTGNLLVLSSQNRIVKIAPDETQTVINTGLNAQYGIDVDDAGNIYVTGDNADGRALLRIDSFGNPSVLVANGLKTPNGAVFDKTGTLYVTNYGDNSIVKIAAGGKISPFVTGLNRPQGITMHSYLEGSILEQVIRNWQSTGLSSAQVLIDANQQKIPIYHLTNVNSAQLLPQLINLDSAVLADVRAALNAGLEVIIPKQQPSKAVGASGMGYIISDPETGAGSYRISGGLDGGEGEAPCAEPQPEPLVNAVHGRLSIRAITYQ